MDQNTPDTDVQAAAPDARNDAAVQADAGAQTDAGAKPAPRTFGQPNYNKTVVAIWAVLLFGFACLLYFTNKNKPPMSKAESLVWEASNLFDRQDFARSTELLRQAAEMGYAPAQTYYGGSLKMGIGVEQNFEEAVRWYRKAADQNYPVAFFELAVCYQHGFGVERDLDQAEYWYHKAYDGGIHDEALKAIDEVANTRARETGYRY